MNNPKSGDSVPTTDKPTVVDFVLETKLTMKTDKGVSKVIFDDSTNCKFTQYKKWKADGVKDNGKTNWISELKDALSCTPYSNDVVSRNKDKGTVTVISVSIKNGKPIDVLPTTKSISVKTDTKKLAELNESF